jgi:DNA polymerase (family X)
MNTDIAKIFFEMSDILELKNIPWKPQAYRIAAQTIESLKQELEDIYINKGIKGLDEIPGIGKGIAKKIAEYIETGKISKYEELKKSIPAGMYEMMSIPGVGVKKSKLFYSEGIKNINDLKKAIKNHKLAGLPGIKEKAEENILQAIEYSSKKRIPLKTAIKIADKIKKELVKIKEVESAVIAGSLRRKKQTIGDIDIIILTTYPNEVGKKFIKMDFVDKIINLGKEKASIFTKEKIQVDIRFFKKNDFGAGLLYFTGDKPHNIWLRKIAIKKGFKLNEYGLYKNNKKIAGKTEEEIYNKLGLSKPNPEQRIGEIK